ncbi:MAG: S8 family serine peptidase [Aquimonas sp.]|nr:S8 family serine peptidase [Aquimonas sp.]
MHTRTALLAASLAAALALSLNTVPAIAGEPGARLVHRADLEAASARGARVLEDYGDVLWVVEAGARPDYRLDLGGRLFDPAEPSQRGQSLSSYGSGPALRLLQFDAPPRGEWLEALKAEGVQPIQYIHPFTYVVWASESAIGRAQARSSRIRYSGEFLPEFKTVIGGEGLKADEAEWQVVLYRGARVDVAQLLGAGAEPIGRAVIDGKFEIAHVRVFGGDSIERLAKVPGVYSVQPLPRDGGLRGELQHQITANNLGGNGMPVVGYPAWLEGLGLSGAGVIMANVDAGIHDTHPDLVGRMLACTGDTCGGGAQDQHGTHTAAIMAGDGSSGVRDANGFLRGLGMAPGANLVEQVYSPHFQQAGGMLKLMRQSYDNNAVLSGNSWGPSGSPRGYDANTRQVDVGSRDVNPTLAGDQALMYVLSIMNGNGGTSSQGSPDEAKNVITVGSTKAQLAGGAVDANFNDLSANSGHGPALDGRRIPHMVTPGCRVDSATGSTSSSFGLLCGTSMASPQVAGALALLIEQYRGDHNGRTPSPALSKAALVAATQSLRGFRDANGNLLGQRPDSRQGWGRLRADWLLAPGVPVLYFDQFEDGVDSGEVPATMIFESTGQSWATSILPADSERPVQVVLVYTDAPGHGIGGSTPAWNNDLDLAIEAGGQRFLGNVFNADGFSITGGSADARNNIEAVMLPPEVAAGGVDIEVIASAITSDALPNREGAADQDFALVCVNCVMGATYGLAADSSRIVACGAGDENVGLALSAIGGYEGSVQLTASDMPMGLSGGFAPATVQVPGNSELALSWTSIADGSHAIVIQGDDGEIQRSRSVQFDFSASLPGAGSARFPANGLQNLELLPLFAWNTSSAGAIDYLLEVATDPAFSNIVMSQRISGTEFRANSALADATAHYWRVTPRNHCGDAAASAVRSFRTAERSCSTVQATGLPLPIGPGAGAITSVQIPVSLAGSVASVSIPNLTGTHTWVSDITGTLDSPAGNRVNFWSSICTDRDNFNFGVSDSAELAFSAIPCPPTSGLIYRPAQPFTALAGQPASGTWTLRLTDSFNQDGGQLQAVSLEICTVEGVSSTDELFINSFEAE